MKRKVRVVLIALFVFQCSLFAQYNFDFRATTDTIVIDTLDMAFYFRLENTGTLPDSYAFDCRIISDTVLGWFEGYCAGGMCTQPGYILYEYLDVGEFDTLIDVTIFFDPVHDSGMEVLNLHVQSVFEPSLVDSITMYAVYGTPGLYSFDFSCLGDTIMMDTAMVEFQFRLENTGTSSDTYAFDLRVIDSIAGWTESFFVDGVWADPGTQLTEYLGIWAVDTDIYVRVDPTTESGTEILNLRVQSTTNPALRDSINIYVIAWVPGIEEHSDITSHQPMLSIKPTVFSNNTNITFSVGHGTNGIVLAIYNSAGQLVRQYDHTTMRLADHIVWDGTDDSGRKLPPGVYFVRFKHQDFVIVDKAVLIE